MAIDWEGEVAAPNVALFGETANYYPVGGGVIPVVGVFDEAYRETEIVDSLSYTSDARPAFGITASQFGLVIPAQNDRLQLSDPASRHFGKKFMVAEPKPDGQGHILLKLNDYTGTLP
jgi:hypothetical protein